MCSRQKIEIGKRIPNLPLFTHLSCLIYTPVNRVNSKLQRLLGCPISEVTWPFTSALLVVRFRLDNRIMSERRTSYPRISPQLFHPSVPSSTNDSFVILGQRVTFEFSHLVFRFKSFPRLLEPCECLFVNLLMLIFSPHFVFFVFLTWTCATFDFLLNLISGWENGLVSQVVIVAFQYCLYNPLEVCFRKSTCI